MISGYMITISSMAIKITNQIQICPSEKLPNEMFHYSISPFSISLRGFDARVNDAVKDFDDKGRNQHHERDQNVTAEISG